MPTTDALVTLIDRLKDEVRVSLDPRAGDIGKVLASLSRSFARYGTSAGMADVSLGETIRLATSTLSQLFTQLPPAIGDDARAELLGRSLAVVAEAHRTATDGHSAHSADEDQFPGTHHARLDALHRINRAATSNLQLDEMVTTVVDVVKRTTRSDASAIFLYNEASGLLSLEATEGLNQNAVGRVTIRAGEGIVGQAAVDGKIIAATNARQHPSYFAHPAIGDDRYASQVSVPMLQGQNRLVGILNIHSIEPRTYTAGELEFLKTVAGELAIAISNAREYSMTDRRLHQTIEELGTLQRITRTVASTLDFNDVLEIILQNAVEMVHAEAAAIFMAGRGEPTIAARIGPIRQLDDEQTRNDVVLKVIRSGSTIRTELAYSDGEAALYCLPLRSARGTVGALSLRMPQRDPVSLATMDMLQSFSDSAAMAIVNAELYKNAMNALETQRTLVQEMHHRVRNNLQTVAALLSLQLRRAEDAPWSFEIREAISRIQSIAAVHDLLSDAKRLSGTTVDVLARMVAEDAHSTLIPRNLRVEFDIEPSTLEIPTKQATVLSLLLNELTSNAIHHGFENKRTGYIRIRAWEENGQAVVEVFNDGHKVPAGFDPSQSQGLGMRITYNLVTSDLHGSFRIESDDAGTTATMRFPIAEAAG